MLVDDDGHLVLLDWELAQIGDPREDLGYFKAVAQAAPPDLTEADEFCARYRELTGFDESQVNPAVVVLLPDPRRDRHRAPAAGGRRRLRPGREPPPGVAVQPQLGAVRAQDLAGRRARSRLARRRCRARADRRPTASSRAWSAASTDDVLPTITDEPARVAVQMIQQLLRGAAVRAAHEIAWMHEEIAAIREAAAPFAGDDGRWPRPSPPSTLSTAPACTSRTSRPATTAAGEVLSRAVEAAFAAGDAEAVDPAAGRAASRAATTRWRSSASSTSSAGGDHDPVTPRRSRPTVPPMLELTADELLTTTRAVRKRLDLERPVPPDAGPRVRAPSLAGAVGQQQPHDAVRRRDRRRPSGRRSATSTASATTSTRASTACTSARSSSRPSGRERPAGAGCRPRPTSSASTWARCRCS